MKRAAVQRRACIPPYFLPLKRNNYDGWWCKLTDGLIRSESRVGVFLVNLHCVATVSYRYLLRVNSKKQAKQPCFLPFPKHTRQIQQLLSYKQTIHVSPCFPLFVNPQTNSLSPVHTNGQVEPLASPLKQVRVRWQGSQINKTKPPQNESK